MFNLLSSLLIFHCNISISLCCLFDALLIPFLLMKLTLIMGDNKKQLFQIIKKRYDEMIVQYCLYTSIVILKSLEYLRLFIN